MAHFTKKLVAAVIFSLSIATLVRAQGMGAYYWGDADGNGDIGAADITSLKSILENVAEDDTLWYAKYPVSRYRQDIDGNGAWFGVVRGQVSI